MVNAPLRKVTIDLIYAYLILRKCNFSFRTLRYLLLFYMQRSLSILVWSDLICLVNSSCKLILSNPVEFRCMKHTGSSKCCTENRAAFKSKLHQNFLIDKKVIVVFSVCTEKVLLSKGSYAQSNKYVL